MLYESLVRSIQRELKLSILYSIVIPTYNRLDVLPEVLQALARQQAPPPFEVIVVDDGSADGTGEWLSRWRSPLPFQVLSQTNGGPALARNRGVEAAKGRFVAFLGDDTVPEEGWLAAHHHARTTRAEGGAGEELAVLGYTAWHPRMRLDPFLDYINEHGLQFGYALIEDPENVPFNFFYTSNISLSLDYLRQESFDLRFPYPAWEDIELSYRLRKRGLRLVYEPSARVAHDHPTTLGRFMERQEKAGYSAVLFHLLHPELGPFLGLGPEGPPPLPPARTQKRRETLARILLRSRIPWRTPRLWEEVLRYHYIRGLHRAWNERQHLAKGDAP
jgi:glycosyltransferase involved in cell wall biosynthesis